MTVVEANILCEDAFILGMLRGVGAVRTELDHETLTIEVCLKAGC
jgi:hypothetical protein